MKYKMLFVAAAIPASVFAQARLSEELQNLEPGAQAGVIVTYKSQVSESHHLRTLRAERASTAG